MSNRKVTEARDAVKKFAFKRGFGGSVDPDAMGRSIEKLYAEKGACAPEDLVNMARPKNSPIHSAFLWDDTEAAELYRKHQARSIIKSVMVVYEDEAEPTQAFVHCSTVGRVKGYYPTETVVSQADLYESAKAELVLQLTHAQSALGNLISAATGKPRQALGKAKTKIEQAATEIAKA